MGALPQQARPEVQRRLTRATARVRARERAEKGELVHLTSPTGRVRVQRGGTFRWERVPAGGLTVHSGPGEGGAVAHVAESKVHVPAGGQVTVHSKSRGRYTLQGGPRGAHGAYGTLAALGEVPPPRSRTILEVPTRAGLVRLHEKIRRDPGSPRAPRR